MRHSGARGRDRLVRGGVAVIAAVVLTLFGTGSGTASAAIIKDFSWSCGSSRGATLHIWVLDDRPATYRTDFGQEGEIPPNERVDIPMGQPREGRVTVAPLGQNPGYIEKTSKVTCDASP